MRLFVGIPLEGPLRAEVESLRPQWERRLESCRWTKPENLHLTVRFLGEVEEKHLQTVKEWFTRAADCETGPLEFDRTGWFRKRERVVFWLGFRKADWLFRLANRFAGPVAGLPEETRPFVAHLTVGRYRLSRREEDQFREFLKFYEQLSLPARAVENPRVVLYQSALHPDGSVYTELMSRPAAPPV